MATEITSGKILYPNLKFNAKYLIGDIRYIKNLKSLLCDQTFLTNLSQLFTEYSDYINGIKYYPFDIREFIEVNPDTSVIKLGNFTLNGNDFRGAEIVNIKKNVLIGTINVTRRYNNFMDFEPYTKVELYVPYFSFITLPVNEVMGKQVSIYLSVDFDTGIGTIYIQVEGRVIMSSSTKLGIDIPIGASNLNEVFKDNIANVGKIVGGVVTAIAGEGIAKLGGLALAGSGALNMATNSMLRYTRGSLTGGTDMLASPTSIYMIVTRTDFVSVDADYNHIKGKPLGETKVLSTLNGFTVVNDIHLEGFNSANDEELKEIKDLLKNGVYL